MLELMCEQEPAVGVIKRIEIECVQQVVEMGDDQEEFEGAPRVVGRKRIRGHRGMRTSDPGITEVIINTHKKYKETSEIY